MASGSRMKICRICKKEKDFIYFYRSDRHKDGYRNECKSCKIAKTICRPSRPRKRNKDYDREYRSRPGVKERRKSYAATYNKEYQRRPEIAERRRIRQQNRRATADRLPPDTISILIDKFGNKCMNPSCQSEKKLTIDHVIPVARGGANNIENLQLLCGKCNSAKGARVVIDYRDFAL